jgi:hypothetical protein
VLATLTPAFSAVVIEWRETGQGGGLFAAEVPQLRQMRAMAADAGDAEDAIEARGAIVVGAQPWLADVLARLPDFIRARAQPVRPSSPPLLPQ